jgi:hypothetical protein
MDLYKKKKQNKFNNVNSIYIKNNICKSMKELNRVLEKDFQNAERNNEMLKRHLEK